MKKTMKKLTLTRELFQPAERDPETSRRRTALDGPAGLHDEHVPSDLHLYRVDLLSLPQASVKGPGGSCRPPRPFMPSSRAIFPRSPTA